MDRRVREGNPFHTGAVRAEFPGCRNSDVVACTFPVPDFWRHEMVGLRDTYFRVAGHGQATVRLDACRLWWPGPKNEVLRRLVGTPCPAQFCRRSFVLRSRAMPVPRVLKNATIGKWSEVSRTSGSCGLSVSIVASTRRA